MPPQLTHAYRATRATTGFTLVELVISLALALLLILGINKVFQISSQTVGAGQSFSTIARDDRTAHTMLWADLHSAVTGTSPAFIIACQQQFAFRNAQDKAGDSDGNPATRDLNGGQITIDPTSINDRSHQVDTLGFFAAGDLYPRQTANLGQYVSPTTATEAYVWYGHVLMPNNDMIRNPPGPNPGLSGPGLPSSGSSKNDNNYYAADWILGRFAMLLVPFPPALDNYIQAGQSGNPLAYDAVSTTFGGSPQFKIFDSRYDIANTSIAKFTTNSSSNNLIARKGMAIFLNNNPPGLFRYTANPFPTKPLTSASMATVSPIFIRNCSQVIIEYAGDYVTQDGNGNVTDPTKGDNQIDYIIDGNTRRIRWYGFPRDINGDGKIDPAVDVVPLRDIRGTASPFEGDVDTAQQLRKQPFGGNYVGTVPAGASYICSWGPDTPADKGTGAGAVSQPLPKLIRITIALDDPNGRIADPQMFEYVIDLQ